MSNTPTYPATPLLETAARILGGEEAPTYTDIAAIIGVADRTISRWAAGQDIPEAAADRAAIALGTHPCLIWPEWWANAPEFDTTINDAFAEGTA